MLRGQGEKLVNEFKLAIGQSEGIEDICWDNEFVITMLQILEYWGQTEYPISFQKGYKNK